MSAAGFLKTNGINLGIFSSDPSNAVQGDTYFNSTLLQERVFNGTSWVPVGSGGFGSGVNFVTNPVADSTEGFSLYDDGATAVPVDGTGGSPSTLTFVRNTSSPIHGTQDFKLSKSAADGQGEGLAYTFTAGSGFPAGTKCLYNFWSKGSANFVTGAASDLRLYLYDITNGALITPTRTSILINGYNVTGFQLTSGTSYRALFHVATTSTLAWDFQFKFLFVGPGTQLAGPNITDWQSFSMTIDAVTTNPTKGTVAYDQAFWKRVGDSMEIIYNFKQTAGGTAGSGVYKFKIPNSLRIDTAKLPVDTESGLRALSGLGRVSDTAAPGPTINDVQVVAFDSASLALYQQNAVTTIGAGIGSGAFGLGNATLWYSFYAKIPIFGWTTDSAVSQSGVLRASDIVANGTRVTSTPTALGQYRTYKKTVSSTAGTDDAPSQTAASIVTDGMRIYSFNFATAGTAGQPSRWEIFIGFNKAYAIRAYSAAARTGHLSFDPVLSAATTNAVYGVDIAYNPTTGVIVFDAMDNTSSTTSRNIGKVTPTAGGGGTYPTDGYFDVLIADNEYQIQLASELNQPVYVKDSKAQGTGSGTFTSGAWQTRDLTVVENPKSWISLSANQITLQAGIYEISASAPARSVDQHKTRWRNITDSTTDIVGSNEFTVSTDAASTQSFIKGIINISTSKTYQLQHLCQTTKTITGFGGSNSLADGVEIYSIVKIVKLF